MASRDEIWVPHPDPPDDTWDVNELLYRAFKAQELDDGVPATDAIDLPGTSVDRARYCVPSSVLDGRPDHLVLCVGLDDLPTCIPWPVAPGDGGCVSVYSFRQAHDPRVNRQTGHANYAHSEIRLRKGSTECDKPRNPELKKRLRRELAIRFRPVVDPPCGADGQ